MNVAAGRDRLGAEWAAAKTVARLFHHLDARDYGAAAALFAADGWWRRLNRYLTGPAAIEAALAARPADLATRHLVTNLLAEADDDGVTMRYYITVFDGSGDGAAPIPLSTPHAIYVSEDRLIDRGGAYRFASRAPELVFRKS